MLEKLSAEERISKAVRLILCRKSTEAELKILNGLLREEKEYYDARPEKAKIRLDIGEFKHAETSDVASTAALMQVVSTLYNTDEAITK
jgi:hypothetical protein